MTEQTTTPEHNHVWPHTDPTPPKKKPWWKAPAALVAFALLLGVGIGAATGPKREPVTITQTVEKPVDKIVEVKVTPASCIKALELNERGFTYAAEAMGYMNEAVQAAGRLNVSGLNAANGKLEIVNPKLTALGPQMNAAKAECRASAK